MEVLNLLVVPRGTQIGTAAREFLDRKKKSGKLDGLLFNGVVVYYQNLDTVRTLIDRYRAELTGGK